MTPIPQETQRALNEAYREANERNPESGALCLLEEQVYQYVGGAGRLWRHICPQRGDQPYGVEYLLEESIPVNLPPLQLISVIIQTRLMASQKEADEVAQFSSEILKAAGWTYPTHSAPAPVTGMVHITEKDKTTPVRCSDIRPVLARLSDPTARGLLLPMQDKGDMWVDLNGKFIEVFPHDSPV